MPIEKDTWLTSVLQRDTYQIIPTHPAVFKEWLAHKTESRGKQVFYYIKIPTNQAKWVSLFTDQGFYLISVNLTFQKEGATPSDRVNSPSAIVRRPLPSDQDRIESIASSCFKLSRFHLDPRITADLSDEIKRQWVKNALDGERGESLAVAEWEGVPVGFLSTLIDRQKEKIIRVVDLLGVDIAYQRKGIGRALLDWFVADSENRFKTLQVGTHIANVAAIHLYEAVGFRLWSSTYVLHGHFNGPTTNA